MDNMLESLARLKNDAETRRSEIQKLEVERQRNRKNIGQAVCNYSMPIVEENLDASESESSLSAIDDVNKPNRRTIKRKRVLEPPWNLPLLNHIRSSLPDTSLMADQLNLGLTNSIAQAAEDRKRKDRELDTQQERLELERQRQKMDMKRQEMDLKLQEMKLKSQEAQKLIQLLELAGKSDGVERLCPRLTFLLQEKLDSLFKS